MKETTNLFKVDYSLRGTAKCMECGKKIIKDDLRIGKMVPYKDKHILRYCHVECAFLRFKRARIASNVISDINQIDGIELLNKVDRDRILKYIEDENNTREKPLPEKGPGKIHNNSSPPTTVKQKRLAPSELPNFTVMFTNADQLTSSKKVELTEYIQREKPMIIAVSEVKPKNTVERETLDYCIPDYSLHPINLDSHVGRGIAIYTHTSMDKSTVQINPEVQFNEVCLLEIKLRGGDAMLFGCFYRSPTATEHSEENNNNLNNLLRKLCGKKKYSHICFTGDFNYRDINWSTCVTPHNERSKEVKFIETLRDCFLHQHVTKPTRRRGNDDPSLIDLILTNEAMQVSNISHHAPLGKSDHSVIVFKFHCYLDYTKPKQKYNYNKADYLQMRNDSIEWSNEFLQNNNDKNVEEAWEAFKVKIYELRNKFVPKTTITGKPSWRRKGVIPIDKSVREAIHRKLICHKKWMNSKRGLRNDGSRAEYTKARNKVKSLMRQAKKRYEKGICLEGKKNPKAFWAHVRQKLKTKSGVAPLLENVNDKESTKFDDKEKADILQRQFAGVFTREPDGDLPELKRRTKITLKDLVLTKEMVRNVTIILNVNKSCGPDEINPKMLLELADQICAPLALIMNKTLQEGLIPKDWKEANISPIFKKGARNKAENYRPISLTSIVCKIMESVVKEVVMKHVLSNKLLSSKQYGFISGRSTVTQLLRYLDSCVETMVNGGVTDTIYLDFAKAFDTVPHRRLLAKLKAYGVNGNILTWIRGFLTGRSQVVKVNGESSFPAPVLSGIPQGSVLGPLLFVLYINDLPENIISSVFLFADDTKMFKKITSENDSAVMQRDINSLEEWTEKWLLRFNIKKCHVLTIGKHENIKHTHRYRLEDNELEHVADEKDLGVTFDSDLTFEDHMSMKVNKANAIVGLIRRSFSFLDENLFKKLYTSFVRPHLEYAQSVWAPHLVKHIEMLEKVQIRATKMVDGFGSLDYSERLRKLDLPTLVYRRARGDMIEVYKHLHIYDQDTTPDRFKLQPRGNRKHDKQLVWNAPKDGARGLQANSFYFRTLKNWDGLTRTAVNAKSINDFKSELDDAWSEKPFKYDYAANNTTTTQNGS